MDLTKAMVGMSVIGDAYQLNGSAIAFILAGKYDEEIRHCYSFMFKHNVNSPEVTDMVERIKSFFRNLVSGIINDAAAKEEYIRQENMKTLLANLKESNRPHEMGTVAEISQKYGISKSEVRRRKADGTLHLLTEKE